MIASGNKIPTLIKTTVTSPRFRPRFRQRPIHNNYYFIENEDNEESECGCKDGKWKWGKWVIGALALLGLVALFGGKLLK